MAAGCDESRAPAGETPDAGGHSKIEGNVAVVRHSHGVASYNDVFSTPKVIRNQDYWEYFNGFARTGWDVDFSTNMVLYCFVESTGSRKSSIRILDISTNSVALRILLDIETRISHERRPAIYNSLDHTMYFHLVELAQCNGRIEFHTGHAGKHKLSKAFPPMTAEQEKEKRRQSALAYGTNLLNIASVSLRSIPQPRDWEGLVRNVRDVYHGDAVPAVRKYVEQGGLWGRLSMIRHLGHVGDEKAIPLLAGLLKKHVTKSDRHAATYALGLIGPDKAVPALAKFFEVAEGEAVEDPKLSTREGRRAFIDKVRSVTGIDLTYHSPEFRKWEYRRENRKADTDPR